MLHYTGPPPSSPDCRPACSRCPRKAAARACCGGRGWFSFLRRGFAAGLVGEGKEKVLTGDFNFLISVLTRLQQGGFCLLEFYMYCTLQVGLGCERGAGLGGGDLLLGLALRRVLSRPYTFSLMCFLPFHIQAVSSFSQCSAPYFLDCTQSESNRFVMTVFQNNKT
jgi:hypothetical protein